MRRFATVDPQHRSTPRQTVRANEGVRPLIALEHFNVETIKGKNSAAAGVTGFILNIVIYYDIVVTDGTSASEHRDISASGGAGGGRRRTLLSRRGREYELAEVNALVKDLTEKLAVLSRS